MNMYQIGITDCDHIAMEEEKAVFLQADVKMKLHSCHSEEDVINEMQSYSVIGNQYAPLTEKVFAALQGLRCVVRYGVGVNHIDLKAAERYGVAVCNVPDYGVQEVAAQAATFMFALCRKLVPMNQSVLEGKWNYELSIPIYRFSQMTIGIIGIGRIGKCFAEIIKGLNCKIIAHDPLYMNLTKAYPDYIEMVDLDTLLKTADVVSIHTPLETSRGLIGRHQLKMMKSSAYIINVSRGGIIDEDALYEALENRWIAGAACDVLLQEPPKSENKLLKCNSFLCTPHMAWYSEQASSDLKTKLAQEIVRALRGEKLHYMLNSPMRKQHEEVII